MQADSPGSSGLIGYYLTALCQNPAAVQAVGTGMAAEAEKWPIQKHPDGKLSYLYQHSQLSKDKYIKPSEACELISAHVERSSVSRMKSLFSHENKHFPGIEKCAIMTSYIVLFSC